MRSDGYQKNFESFCENGVTHRSDKIYCGRKSWLPSLHLHWPHLPSFSFHFSKFFKFIGLLGLIGLGYVVYVNQYYFEILDKLEEGWEFVKNIRTKQRIDSNVYSELKQSEFNVNEKP